MDDPGYSVAENNVVVANGMTTDDAALRFGHFVEAPANDLLEDLCVALGWKTHQGKCGDWAASHGVYIAERVGGGNLSEDKWIICDGCEEIDSLHDGKILFELIDTGIVICAETNKNVGIAGGWQTSQNGVQDAGTQFGCTSGGLHHGCESYGVRHGAPPFRSI